MKDAAAAATDCGATRDADRSGNDGSCPLPGSACPLCEAAMFGVHCKQVCPNCGYKEDCSDLFRV
ncbi:MAG: hypothetical protein ACKVS9_16220 [Phycisphaerae bacterium]